MWRRLNSNKLFQNKELDAMPKKLRNKSEYSKIRKTDL